MYFLDNLVDVSKKEFVHFKEGSEIHKMGVAEVHRVLSLGAWREGNHAGPRAQASTGRGPARARRRRARASSRQPPPLTLSLLSPLTALPLLPLHCILHCTPAVLYVTVEPYVMCAGGRSRRRDARRYVCAVCVILLMMAYVAFPDDLMWAFFAHVILTRACRA